MSISIINNKKECYTFSAKDKENAIDQYIKEQLVYGKNFTISPDLWNGIKAVMCDTTEKIIETANKFIKKDQLKIKQIQESTAELWPITINFSSAGDYTIYDNEKHYTVFKLNSNNTLEKVSDYLYAIQPEELEEGTKLIFKLIPDTGFCIEQEDSYDIIALYNRNLTTDNKLPSYLNGITYYTFANSTKILEIDLANIYESDMPFSIEVRPNIIDLSKLVKPYKPYFYYYINIDPDINDMAYLDDAMETITPEVSYFNTTNRINDIYIAYYKKNADGTLNTETKYKTKITLICNGQPAGRFVISDLQNRSKYNKDGKLIGLVADLYLTDEISGKGTIILSIEKSDEEYIAPDDTQRGYPLPRTYPDFSYSWEEWDPYEKLEIAEPDPQPPE